MLLSATCSVSAIISRRTFELQPGSRVGSALLLYTVHTPVPAGHDYFDEALFGKYMGGYPQRLGISWDEFIGMGREMQMITTSVSASLHCMQHLPGG